MKRNMKEWIRFVIASPEKKPIPVLSFPAVSLMGVTVKDLISSSELQAEGMKRVADRVPSGASVSLMDLSVEAEAFGSAVRFSTDEVPTVLGAVVSDEDEAKALAVPKVGAGRTGLYVEAIRKAAERITDRPVFAGVIGPFSLAGRLMDVSEALVYCYEEPDMVHTVMEKATEFLISYCLAYREAGANGVVMAEPLTGLLSPALADEFSHPYVKKIIDAVQTDEFAVIYHNCGGSVPQMKEGIYRLCAMGYHFGDAVDMSEMVPAAPKDAIVMGNVSPSAVLRNGNPELVREKTLEVLNAVGSHPNFVLSSGCDMPPMTPWDNIDAFFRAFEEWNK